MTNIEKLLSACVSSGGEKLVIEVGESPYIVKPDGSKSNISQQLITERILLVLKSEFLTVFNNQTEFVYQFKEFVLQKSPTSLIFSPKFPLEKSAEASKFPLENSTESEVRNPAKEEAKPEKIREAASKLPENYSGNDSNFSIIAMLHEMIEKKASDLHLTSKCKPVMRIDGDMIILENNPQISEEKLWNELKKITPEININEFSKTNDTDYAYEIEGLARFRSNIFRDNKGIGAVFRQIPSKILSAEQLNLPKIILDICSVPKGLILVTGPTGSGKSTTLAAMIDYINANFKKHIITIEDPVEFVHQNKQCFINQREVKTHTESFKRALKAALREDPDIILVGELRDLETIAIAIEMAVTGHLVFGTLHTNTAVGTVDRIIDQFPADQQSQIKTMLADALQAVVAQMLCKKKGGGRRAALEILLTNMAVSNLIREGKTFQIPAIMQSGKAMGMRLMNDSFLEMVASGEVEAEEALSKSADREALKNSLKTKGLL